MVERCLFYVLLCAWGGAQICDASFKGGNSKAKFGMFFLGFRVSGQTKERKLGRSRHTQGLSSRDRRTIRKEEDEKDHHHFETTTTKKKKKNPKTLEKHRPIDIDISNPIVIVIIIIIGPKNISIHHRTSSCRLKTNNNTGPPRDATNSRPTKRARKRRGPHRRRSKSTPTRRRRLNFLEISPIHT